MSAVVDPGSLEKSAPRPTSAEARKLLGVPGDYEVIALLPIGTPAETPGPQSRKDLAEIVCYDRFA